LHVSNEGRNLATRHDPRLLVLLEVDQEFGELGDGHSALNHKPSIRVGMAAVSDRRHR
jgi:hypothetical protein